MVSEVLYVLPCQLFLTWESDVIRRENRLDRAVVAVLAYAVYLIIVIPQLGAAR